MNSYAVIIQPVSRTVSMIMGLSKILVNRRTKYQHVLIVELEEFGKTLILDGLVQSAEADEFLYHESLTHPALVTHPEPKKVLIIGGGEGAALREVLKHATVSKVTMVDIDGELVELAREYLEVMHRGAFNDPRSEVIIMDGFKYIAETNESFDVVIMDLTDPHGPEIAKALYSKESYVMLKKRLKEDGIMVTQCGNSFFFPNTYRYVLENVKSVFNIVREYSVWVPSFGYSCNFIIASDRHDPLRLKAEEVDATLSKRGVKTRFYSGLIHESLMRSLSLYNEFSAHVDRT